jgi:hypothetical protein
MIEGLVGEGLGSPIFDIGDLRGASQGPRFLGAGNHQLTSTPLG